MATTYKAKVWGVHLALKDEHDPITLYRDEHGDVRIMVSVEITMNEIQAANLRDILIKINELDKDVYLIV